MFFGPTNSAVWVPSDLFHPMFCVRQTWWPSGGPHLTSVVGQYVRPDHLTSVVGLIWLVWWANMWGLTIWLVWWASSDYCGGPHLTGMVGQCVRPDQPPPSEQLGAGWDALSAHPSSQTFCYQRCSRRLLLWLGFVCVLINVGPTWTLAILCWGPAEALFTALFSLCF